MANIAQNVTAITVAVIVFAVILVPMLGSATEQTVDGEKHTAMNTAPSTYLDVYRGIEPITITYTSSTPQVTTSISGLTAVVTESRMITINGTTVTVLDTNGQRTVTADTTITVPAGNKVLICASGTTSATAKYGIYTSFTTPIYVEGSKSLIAMSTASPYIASERYNGQSIPMTSEPYADHHNIYAVTAVSNSGSLVAPLEYVWYDQIPAMDDTVKMILDILPILIVVGLLMTCVYMFFTRGGRY